MEENATTNLSRFIHTHDTWAFYYYMNAKFIYCDSDKQLCQAQTKSSTEQANRVSHLLQTIHPLCVRECCWTFSILTTKRKKMLKSKKLQPCCALLPHIYLFILTPHFHRHYFSIHMSKTRDFCGWLKIKIFVFAIKPKIGRFPAVAANN